MIVLAAPPRPAPAADDPDPPATPGIWDCPRCPYRIALDFPNGCEDAIVEHALAHTVADLGRPYAPTFGRLRPSNGRGEG